MSLVRRIVFFFRKNGLRSTIRRSWTAIQRICHLGRMCLFDCSLPVTEQIKDAGVTLERVVDGALSDEDRSRLLDFWCPVERADQMANRFAAGSVLWLARVNGVLAGYGWTLLGSTVKPYFFPIRKDDVHFYDFYVYPEFRGRGINVELVNSILYALDDVKARRALIECASWNTSQLRSLSKTWFLPYATASKVSVFGRSLVFWYGRQTRIWLRKPEILILA